MFKFLLYNFLFSYICAVSDINECDLNTHNCSNHANCFNTNGSFVCNCSDGFSGNGVICEGMPTIIFFRLNWIRLATNPSWLDSSIGRPAV